jgi:hypothetical protein
LIRPGENGQIGRMSQQSCRCGQRFKAFILGFPQYFMLRLPCIAGHCVLLGEMEYSAGIGIDYINNVNYFYCAMQ